MNFSDEERDFYEDHLKWMMIEASTVKKAEEKAEARGKAEGLAEGKAEEKIEIAKNFLSQNIDITTISKATGLLIEEITKLR